MHVEINEAKVHSEMNASWVNVDGQELSWKIPWSFVLKDPLMIRLSNLIYIITSARHIVQPFLQNT